MDFIANLYLAGRCPSRQRFRSKYHSSVAIWKLEAKGCDVSVSVTRIKGIGDGAELELRIEQIELEGEDDFGLARTGAVMIRQFAAGIRPRLHQLAKTPRPVSDREVAVLTTMRRFPGASFKELAKALVQAEVSPLTGDQVRRVIDKLAGRGLVEKGEGGHYSITEAGNAQMFASMV